MISRKGFAHALVICISLFICMAGALGSPSASSAADSVLHSFSGSVNDGGRPSGDLTLYGTTFYGMTTFGGGDSVNCGGGGCGTIFATNTDGTGFQVLHTFNGTPTANNPGTIDGSNPLGNLTLSGTTLYGMTSGGGANKLGTIFKINTDGSGYQLLYSFGLSDGGGTPGGSLTVSGNMLYGMTSGTMTSAGQPTLGYGVVFQINTNGSGFTVLHNFANDGINGVNPDGSLTLSGSTLYGMTSGGCTGYGTIFKINTDGSGFQTLYDFSSASGANGAYPNGSVILAGSTLYGMTTGGGSGQGGTIFRINTDGSNFQVLKHFQGYPSHATGNNPFGSLTLAGSTLYGMSVAGGAGDSGVIFQLNTDGSGYQILHSFGGGTGDGSYPLGSLAFSGSTLCGMTQSGGANNNGTIFSLSVSVAKTLLWAGTGGYAALWTLDSSNTKTGDPTYGPYSGWTPVSYSLNSDGTRALLWAGTGGYATLWTLDSSNAVTSDPMYGPYSGWTPVNYSINPDGTRTLLWAGTGGYAALWTLDSTNTVTASRTYGPCTGWRPVSYSLNPDGTRTLLWAGTGGYAALWALDSSNTMTDYPSFGPYSGWTPLSYSVNPDGTRTLLWAGTGGYAALWTLDSSNTMTASKNYGPYSGWTPLSYSVNPDGTRTLLWAGTGGYAALWTLDSSNTMIDYPSFGPYSGWTPIKCQ